MHPEFWSRSEKKNPVSFEINYKIEPIFRVQKKNGGKKGLHLTNYTQVDVDLPIFPLHSVCHDSNRPKYWTIRNLCCLFASITIGLRCAVCANNARLNRITKRKREKLVIIYESTWAWAWAVCERNNIRISPFSLLLARLMPFDVVFKMSIEHKHSVEG